MSSDQSLDAQLIEQTKQQIRALVNEIAQLSKSGMAPANYYGEFLPRVVSALAAVGGVVWALEESDRLALQFQVNLRESGLADKSREEQARHGLLLQQVMTTGEGILVPPQSGAGDNGVGANPTDYLLVIGPLKTELEVVGVVEIFQRPDTVVATQKGYLRFLLQMCELAGEFLKGHQLRHFSDRQVLWTQLEEFTRQVHGSLNPRDTAYTIANDGRRLIECDRVSVAIRKGRKCRIEAVSGQDFFDKRSNTIRLLGRLATVVVASGEPMWYSGDTSNMAPQVEDAVQEYVDESHTKSIAVLPLRREEVVEKERERPDDPLEMEPAIGALIVEQIEDARMAPPMVQRVEVIARHSSMAMANAIEHEDLFLMPVWRTLGKTRIVLRARMLPKVLAGVIAVVALVVALFVVPADFLLFSKGTLEPVERRDVFAGVDGIVIEVLVKHGDLVQQGQRLVHLRNTDLQVALADVQGQLTTTQEQINSLYRIVVEGKNLTAEERARMTGQFLELQEKKRSLKNQLDLQREKERELNVASPEAGLIVTWDLYNRLIQRPVQKGQVLLRVADPSKEWQLELHMPEDRMGHIAQAQAKLFGQSRVKLHDCLETSLHDAVRDRLKAELLVKPPAEGAELVSAEDRQAEIDKQVEAQLPERLEQEIAAELTKMIPPKYAERIRELTGEDVDDRLDVSYVLATDPSTTHYGKVKEMALSAEVRGEEGNTVLIKVTMDKNDLKPEHIRPGASVTAKVDCGRRAIGYVWFHDAIAFARKTWFRWF